MPLLRFITSIAVIWIYLLVVLAPLAPAALKSKLVLHSLTGQCVQDCRICGCDPARSEARSCCCWQKKLSLKIASGGGCSTVSKGSCCDAKAKADEHDSETMHAEDNTAPGQGTFSISAIPCGNTKHLAFSSLAKIQHYPFVFITSFPVAAPQEYPVTVFDRMLSRFAEPPDPPPKIPMNA